MQQSINTQTAFPLSDAAGREAYQTHLKPYLARLLSAIGLVDVCYERGEGDYLYYQDSEGREEQVLDMLGGYGATLFGHNHPELVEQANAVLATKRPFVMCGSTRAYAGLLAKRLSDLVGAVTGQGYVATLANSGAEAVEAALKHAELERATAVQAIFTTLDDSVKAIRTGLTKEEVTIEEGFYAEVAHCLNVPEITNLDALHFYLNQHNQQALLGASHYLAIKGAFHGKTTGALKMTHNPLFRNPWHGVGLQAHFLPRNDTDALAEAVQEAETSYFTLRINQMGTIELVEESWSQIVACLIEPIQGEGGIHELSPAWAAALRAAADRARFPLIIDEIQSGMGRTGTFLASEALGIAGDYYLFSKALGGGLAKVSALLVPHNRYVEEFGYIHTSTFADDDFSSAIALKALDLVTRDEGMLMEDCRVKGDFLLHKLRELQARYPQVIQDVRGRGLMLGIELVPQQDSASKFLRLASEQNLLTYLLCGYLLHEDQIRIAPTLSANHTIRIEPSAYIPLADLVRFYEALERAVQYIAAADTGRFVGYLVGRGGVDRAEMDSDADFSTIAEDYQPALPAEAQPQPKPPIVRKVACIAHFIDPQDLLHWDPTLGPLTDVECEALLERTDQIIKPFIVDEQVVQSPHGEAISLTVIGIPLTSSQIMARMKRGDGEAVLDQIKNAVALAEALGCALVGFTGYTSIVTNNCLALVADRAGLTSGNSLTAFAAVEGTHIAAAQQGIDVAHARLGVVGAVGNIGKVLAQVEVDHVASILLVGRAGGQRRLQRVADELYAHAWSQVLAGHHERGIAHTIATSGLLAHLDRVVPPAQIGAAIRAGCTALGLPEPIQISTDLRDLRACDLIISATNAPQPFIGVEQIGNHPTVICDVATPTDVKAVVKELPNVVVIKGGVLQLPDGQKLSIGGLRLAEGHAFACISEVLVLGMAGSRDHFSYGALDPAQVRQIGELAELYGFGVTVRGT